MSENKPKKMNEKMLKDLNINTEDEKKQYEIQDINMDDSHEQIDSNNMVLEMFKKTIFPALKSRIEFLEEQLSIKEQKLEAIKMKEDLSELILDSPLPLPV